MSHRSRLLINFVGFQIAWFACVLSAANNQPIIGICIALVIVLIHLYLSANRTSAFTLLAIITLMGSAWDSVLTNQQILVFSSGMMLPFLAPTWIFAMWLSFSTTINTAFRWLYHRYFLAFILGAISGPLTYQAGAALDAVVIPNSLTATVWIAIGWGVMMPLFILIAERFETIDTNKNNGVSSS